LEDVNLGRLAVAAAVGAAACSVGFSGDRALSANRPGTISGTGTATIDGVLSPGEWDHAATLDFAAPLPAAEGGGSVPGRAYVMNDGANLYLAARLARDTYGFGAAMTWFFDRSNDTSHENGDDTVYVQVWRTMGLIFYDGYRWQCPGAPAGAPAFCGAAQDTVQVQGAPPPGTIDGQGAVREGGGVVVFEASHPLDSADDAHDFSLGAGSLIGYQASTRFVAPCQTDPGCWADAVVPEGHVGISPGAELTVVARAAPARVRVKKTLTYTITVSAAANAAPARDVTLDAELSPRIRPTAVRTAAGTCDAGFELRCSLGTIAPGSRAVVTVRARAVRAGRASLTAVATTASFESATSRDEATATAAIRPR
jgi:hypothetical protein